MGTKKDSSTVADDGGPAFPSQFIDHLPEIGNVAREQYAGISRRDYFAAKALLGMTSNSNWNEASWEKIAAQAFIAADEMLKASVKYGV